MSPHEVDFQRFQKHIQKCIQNEALDFNSVLDYLADKANPDAFAVLRITSPATAEQVNAAAIAQDVLIRQRTRGWPHSRSNHNLRQIIGDAKTVLATPEKQASYRQWIGSQEQARAREAQAGREEQAKQKQRAEEQRHAAEQEAEKQAREERARKWQWLRLILTDLIFWTVLFTAVAFAIPTIRLWVGGLAMICAVVAWRQTPRTAFLRRRIVDTAFYGAAGLVFITVVHIPGFGVKTNPVAPQSNPTSVLTHSVPVSKSPKASVINSVNVTSSPSTSPQMTLAESQRHNAMILANQKTASAKRVNNEISTKLSSLQDQQQRGVLTEENAATAKAELKPMLQKALADSEYAISLDGTNKNAWFQRVCTLYFWGKYPEADHYLRQATVKFPECNDFDPLRPLIQKHLR